MLSPAGHGGADFTKWGKPSARACLRSPEALLYNRGMTEREAAAEASPERGESILLQGFVEAVLTMAQENLRRHGALAPVLFVRFQGGEQAIAPLDLPATTEEKEAYLAALGLSFRQTGRVAEEALFVSETWYVAAEPGQRLNLDVAPGRHPRRQEAIAIVGRNAEHTRHTMVIQTFGRDRAHRPVLGRIEVAEYNAWSEPGSGPVGLLDHLFPRRTAGFSMN